MSKPPVSVHWFRRDLRLEDNHALWHALRSGVPTLPLFIFDTEILDELADKRDRRVDFIHRHLWRLKENLEVKGSTLLVEIGTPEEAWRRILDRFDVKVVHTNRDHEAYAVERDERVAQLLAERGIAFHHHKDQSVFERGEVLKDDGLPYTVFTPYMRKWRAQFRSEMLDAFASEEQLNNLHRCKPASMPSLQEIGFAFTDLVEPVARFDVDLLRNYPDQRNLPAVVGTSRSSTHLRFGTVSVREVLRASWNSCPAFANELIWREFFMQILWHFPQVVTKAFKPVYDNIAWRNNETEFDAWCEGRTGYPIVDAGMRELNATGLMHNRVRMVTASFLTKHLLIDWRWGEAYFAKKLLDYELSSNNGNWQWASGSGCDAAPYFRIFSPAAQTERFDSKLAYIKRWIPELGTPGYPKPVVDHDFARKRALDVYKKGLASTNGTPISQPQLFI